MREGWLSWLPSHPPPVPTKKCKTSSKSPFDYFLSCSPQASGRNGCLLKSDTRCGYKEDSGRRQSRVPPNSWISRTWGLQLYLPKPILKSPNSFPTPTPSWYSGTKKANATSCGRGSCRGHTHEAALYWHRWEKAQLAVSAQIPTRWCKAVSSVCVCTYERDFSEINWVGGV